jgi:competence protein ComGC
MQIRQQRGLQLFEVMLVLAIIGLLMYVSADKVLALRADVERSSVEQAINTLNAALAMQSAQYIVDRDRASLNAMRHGNPLQLLAGQGVELDHYLGERYGPAPEVIDPGHWVFDQRENMLIYRLRYPQSLQTPLQGPARLRLRVELEQTTQASLAQLQAVEAYQWTSTP